MKISAIETRHYQIPLPAVLTDSTHGAMKYFELVTATVRCDGGEQGLGYTYTVGAGGASIRALIDRDLAALLTGRDPRRTEELWRQMWWALHYVGRGGIASFAISAIDIALWDLKSSLAGEPLWRFLGGHSPRVKVYSGGIDLLIPLDELREQTRLNLARGFRAFKIKVGRERLAEDISRVEAVRDVLGPDLPLMVDANMRWTVEQAVRASRALAPFDVYWLEEPVAPDDVEGHARIAEQGSVPLATGENLHTIYEFQKLIAHGGISFPEPDLTNVGGVTAWMKVAHLAEAYNLPVTTHGVHDLHVHLLAAVPNASYLEVHGFGLEASLRHPLEIRDGEVTAPGRPGHGVEFDWHALQPYQILRAAAAVE